MWNKKMVEKIKFKELNLICKIGIIGGWVIILIYILPFILGFLWGLFSW